MIITMNELSKLYAAKLVETGSHDQAMLHVWWVAYNTDRPEGWAKKQFFTEPLFVFGENTKEYSTIVSDEVLIVNL